VPTWNFVTVQAKGTLTFHEEDEWKRSHVESLTNFHESAFSFPWSVADAPSDFVDEMSMPLLALTFE
jgi:transcriptional regulator